ncbi:hypothetical protein DLAC_02638 [Tieghemostelium lacteum]|uniref:Uncharacterized protein n=1 Tax=Tieghemostelium lacteum TaxID=361077 RepID=A0A152A331_TIELA|nr:hypothetical protein DLAC_02638 [Tieghemostelium lacteum]|eukprot:KYR00614.1 hypothetical protein DLAC_02638 [Tieghemostelium lacteum]
MSSTGYRKRIVHWSPHKSNSFIVGSNDIRLYNIKYENEIQNNTCNFDMEYPNDDYESNIDKKILSLVSINSVELVRCMAWSPDPSDPNLIACGLTNGKTVLTSFTSLNRVLKEFSTKHSRHCNVIAWNPIFKNQIAVGLDKVRNDLSTLIWDINYSSSVHNSSPPLDIDLESVDAPHTISRINDNTFHIATDTEVVSTPLKEFTLSEATLSLAWLLSNPFCLAVGTGSKWLKVHDIRSSNTLKSVTAYQKSCVNGISVDPFDHNRIATISDDPIIKIWDIRKFDDPILQINTFYKTVQQIEWSPTRSGVLAACGKEKNSIKIYDIKAPLDYNTKSPRNDQQLQQQQQQQLQDQQQQQHRDQLLLQQQQMSKKSSALASSLSSTSLQGGDGSSLIVKPNKVHYATDVLSSFSWHPTNECRMLTVTYSDVVEVVSINDNIPVAWSPQGQLVFSYGKQLLEGPIKGTTLEPDLNVHKNLQNDGRYNKDISMIMKERALFGYSRNVDNNVNFANRISDDNISLLWNWIQKIPILIQSHKKKLLSGPQQDSNTPRDRDSLVNDYLGIYNIVFDKDIQYNTPTEQICGFLVYKSQNRFLCSTICGWGFGVHNPIDSYLTKLEKNGEFEKAVSISIFHLEIKRSMLTLQHAIQYLQQPAQQLIVENRDRLLNFKVLSIALAGFGDGNSNAIWRETCKQTAKSFHDPYLKTSLEFLASSDSREILSVLDEAAISLCDKISFACRYLDLQDLCAFVERTTQQMVEQGNLQGVILTGLSQRGIELFQNYIDKSGDIQTSALACSIVVPKFIKDKRVERWIQIYCDLLDIWKLWHERAIFDIQRLSTESLHSTSSGPHTISTPNSISSVNSHHTSSSTTTSTAANSSSTGTASAPVQSQIFAKCGYCQCSFSFESVSTTSMMGRNVKPSTTKAKVTCCPHCKQALPRCCLCLLPLNCMIPTVDYKKSKSDQTQTHWSEGSEPFDDWFTWCQTCRHGGHAQHILDWFKEHTVCAVTDCNCKCNSI